jgi:N-methylhydantoinase B/oxoprolinase/acetone carboxylase alpha subunit
VRNKIEAIADGSYYYEYEVDGYDQPLKIAATLTIKGSDIAMDCGVRRWSSARSTARWLPTPTRSPGTLICAINSRVPNNEGMLRLVHGDTRALHTQSGSILRRLARNLTGIC